MSDQSAVIRQALEPVVELNEKLDRNVAELEAQLKEARDERRQVRALLRAGGLIEPQKPKQKKRGNGEIDPRQRKSLEAVEAAIGRKFDGDEFSVRMVAEQVDLSEAAVRSSLKRLHKEGKLILIGARPASERSTAPTTFYKADN